MIAMSRRLFANAVLLLAGASVVVPFLAILSAALQPSSDLTPSFSWPKHPAWGNFADAWSVGGFGDLFRSSAIIAVSVVPIGLVAATLAGYGLSMLRVPGRRLIFSLFLLGLALPYEVIVIPLYYDLQPLHLLNTYWALILPLSAAFMPFGVFWMRTHFDSMPPELAESAALDGASDLRILIRVFLPSARPALTALGLLYFLWAWNQFLLALILVQNPTLRTVTTGLAAFERQYSVNIPLMAAGTLIIITPAIVVYFVFQRHFVQGLLHGAIKG
jgi:ABC-type glycerol-3-phosphate transport system permease component